jgi:quercetin dioxygenase-like cupin family protein
MSETAGHAYTRSHRISGKTLLLDLDAEAEAVLSKARTARSGRAARTLVKEGLLRLTVVGIKSGASLRNHKAEGAVGIQVLIGTVEVSVGKRSERLNAQTLLTLQPGVAHSLFAPADAVVLLTIAMQP